MQNAHVLAKINSYYNYFITGSQTVPLIICQKTALFRHIPLREAALKLSGERPVAFLNARLK